MHSKSNLQHNFEEAKPLEALTNMSVQHTLLTDEQKCAKYSLFMWDFPRPWAEGVYWGFLCLIGVGLIVSSAAYNHAMREFEVLQKERDIEAVYATWSPEALIRKERAHRRAMTCCFLISCICFIISATSVFMQCLAMNNLQFCSGEDFMYFYTSLLGTLSIGATIAILGVCVHQFCGLWDLKHPVWAVGLGTPVSLICAIAHYVKQLSPWNFRNMWYQAAAGGSMEQDLSGASNVSTCYSVPLITPENGVVIQFWQGGHIPENTRVLGIDSLGHKIIEFLPPSASSLSQTSLTASSDTLTSTSLESTESTLNMPSEK